MYVLFTELNIRNVKQAPINSSLQKVVRVIDGDTIVCQVDNIQQPVRMIGIDTPESVHPDTEKNTEAGKVASYITKNLLTDKTVWLETDIQVTDKYGRLLALCVD